MYFEALDFLIAEAEALDECRLDDWLGMLAPNVTYRAPVRVSQRRDDGDGFVGSTVHFDDDRASLELRVRRLDRFGWAEDPASRTRRIVTNVRVSLVEPDALAVRSYLLLLKSHGDAPDYELVAAERHDLLGQVNGEWKLVDRDIRLAQTNLGVMALFM